MRLPLKELRKQKGMTQVDLSKALQISASAVAMYETGRREPDFETLKKISKFFNVSVDYLLGNNTQNVRQEITENQTKLVDGYDELNDDGQNMLLSYLSFLKQSHSKLKVAR